MGGGREKTLPTLTLEFGFFFYMKFSHQSQKKRECKYFGAYGIFGLKNDSFLQWNLINISF